jgi:hypothetical protein
MTVASPSSAFALDTSPEAQAARRRGKTGNRNKLAQRFFESTYAAWEEQGDQALRRAAFHDPMGFVNMVARLMPQKIEHLTPTDGMTDERLAQLLDLAEGMLRLRASHPHLLDHENGLIDVSLTKGGGGPDRSGDAAGGGSTSTIRDAAEPERQEALNGLNVSREHVDSVYDDRTPVTPFRSENAIPHPVGRPFPKEDHVVSAENRRGLELTDDIDPASLF